MVWGAHTGAGSCQDLRTCGESNPRHSRFGGRAHDPVEDPRWSSLFLKDCTLWRGPTLGQFVQSCSPWEGPTLQTFVENCLLWVCPHAGAGAECEESSPEGQGAAETTCDELTITPVPLRHLRGGGGGRETGVKLSPGRREGWGEGVLKSGFISHYPTWI